MLYAVVNTFTKPHGTFGRIESCHKTEANAQKARQSIWKKLSGNQYLPLEIVELRAGKRAGQSIPCAHLNENEPDREVAEKLYR